MWKSVTKEATTKATYLQSESWNKKAEGNVIWPQLEEYTLDKRMDNSPFCARLWKTTAALSTGLGVPGKL